MSNRLPEPPLTSTFQRFQDIGTALKMDENVLNQGYRIQLVVELLRNIIRPVFQRSMFPAKAIFLIIMC